MSIQPAYVTHAFWDEYLRKQGFSPCEPADIPFGWAWYGAGEARIAVNIPDLRVGKYPRIRINFKGVMVDRPVRNSFSVDHLDDLMTIVEAMRRPEMALICLAWEWTAPIVEIILKAPL